MRLLTDEEMGKILGIDFTTAYSGHIAEYKAIRDAQADLTRKEIDKKVKAYFETEPWMTLEDWRILKLGSKGE